MPEVRKLSFSQVPELALASSSLLFEVLPGTCNTFIGMESCGIRDGSFPAVPAEGLGLFMHLGPEPETIM